MTEDKWLPGGRVTVNAGWDHVPHLTEEDKADQLASYQPFQREARSKGLPVLGAGKIYPVPEDRILCDPFEIPDWMPRCYALDVGWKMTAALWAAHDPNTDILYLYSEHYLAHAEPLVHIAAIQSRGKWIPGVIDPAARGRNIKDGTKLIEDYQKNGLEHLYPSSNELEAGIQECWVLLSTGRIKVFRTLTNYIQELRFYQRDERGKIKDGQADHLMDCKRYIVLSGQARAVVPPPSLWKGRNAQPRLESDYDPLAY